MHNLQEPWHGYLLSSHRFTVSDIQPAPLSRFHSPGFFSVGARGFHHPTVILIRKNPRLPLTNWTLRPLLPHAIYIGPELKSEHQVAMEEVNSGTVVKVLWGFFVGAYSFVQVLCALLGRPIRERLFVGSPNSGPCTRNGVKSIRASFYLHLLSYSINVLLSRARRNFFEFPSYSAG